MPPTHHVVLVDDDRMIVEVVSRFLVEAGFSVDPHTDGDEALAALREQVPDLVVLDVMLPGTDGLTILRELRRDHDVPVILLTARGAEGDRVGGLELGADDYVVKPFSPRELVARCETVLRRAAPRTSAAPVEVGGLRIDPTTRECVVDGEPVELTRLEFDLLLHLARHPRQVFSRAQLLDAVWDSSPDWQDPSTVTVHVRRLRSKVERDPDDPQRIVTAWGVGYRFEP